MEIIDPQKGETVLDPACGTAGFLISAYKRILDANSDADGRSTLTPDEMRRLADDFSGYDISPDMVRLSLVNMYLHGFREPHVHEYDTLTSEDRWNEYADVILANPPFMSPRGGIRPHNRFSVQSRRSEVLFVDYIAEHLTANGRAGVIVPEGIIFQSQNAYKQLRKVLVKEYLVAVISLPAGVFRPYSGVKTSILIMDKSLAKRADGIAFFKVENDGYDLGAQRRPIDRNDLPDIARVARKYLQAVPSTSIQETSALYNATSVPNDSMASTGTLLIVSKDKIAESEDYNLSGELYREDEYISEWPMVALSDAEVFQVESGGTPKSDIDNYWNGDIPWITLADLPPENFISEIVNTQRTISEDGLQNSSAKLLPPNSVVVSSRATIGRIGINRIPLATNQGFKNIVIKDTNRAIPEYVAISLTKLVPEMQSRASGSTYKEITKTGFSDLRIPLPPLGVQREIVSEIEDYQKVISGARAVIENWRPYISANPEWPLVQLESVAEVIAGQSPPGESYNDTGDGVPFYQGRTEFGEVFIGEPRKWTTEPRKFAENGDILMSVRAPVGPVNLATERVCIGRGLAAIRATSRDRLLQNYAFYVLRGLESRITGSDGAVFASINKREIEKIEIPLPLLDIQRAIVAEVEAERAIVAANRELIHRMEKKIESAISRVWNQ